MSDPFDRYAPVRARMATYQSRPGKHGTEWLFRITYRDPDPGAPDFTLCVWRYSRSHAEESFLESNDGDDWKIVRIEHVRIKGAPRRRRRRDGGL